MARRIPKLCRHKTTGIAYVTDPALRREVYLKTPGGSPARHGTPEADRAYDDWVREFLDRARPDIAPGMPGCTVNRLLDAFLAHADLYYRKRGKVTSEVGNFEAAARAVRALGLGDSPAAGFRPRDLAHLQKALAAKHLARSTVNAYCRRVVRIWRWAVAQELVRGEVLVALEAIPGLARGRTAARETAEVGPVDLAVVEACLPHLPPTAAAVVRAQLAAAMRPAEVLALRPCELDTSAEPWAYTVAPDANKTAHKGRARVVYLGPQARGVLGPWVARCHSRSSWVFPGKKPGAHYTHSALRAAIDDAVARAGVPHWHPNQLRHTQATVIRAKYGAEAAQAVLGHASMDTTEIYAERDSAVARKAAEDLG